MAKLQGTYQMPEMLRDHQLQGLSSTCGITGDHGISGHNLMDLGGMGFETIRGHLQMPY